MGLIPVKLQRSTFHIAQDAGDYAPRTTKVIEVMSDAQSEVPVASLFDEPPRGPFDTFCLISHPRHLDQVGDLSGNVLLIATDWLLMQDCLSKGLSCISLDTGQRLWKGEDNLAEDANLRSADFAYHDGQDLTMFQGVSLGRLFSPRLSTFLVALERITRGLGALIEHYQPKKIIAYDCFPGFGTLGPYVRRQLVTDIVADHDIAFTDRWDPLSNDDPSLPFLAEANKVNQQKRNASALLLQLCRQVYSYSIDCISQLLMRRRQNRTLLLLNLKTTDGLLDNFPRDKVTPTIVFESNRKNFRIVFKYLLRGVLIVGKRIPKLDPQSRKDVQKINDALLKAHAGPSTGADRAIRNFVNDRLLKDGQMEALAQEVLAAKSLLERYRPSRVVVDGVRNLPLRSFIDVANTMGIPVDYTWHAPIAPKRQKWDAFGNDPRTKVSISRALSWGPVFEEWMAKTGPGIPCIRTGTTRVPDRAEKCSEQMGRRILILDYNSMSDDSLALDGYRFEFFVKAVRLLREMGYEDIAIKLHPGRPRAQYFEAVAEKFNLNCPVYKSEPLTKILDDFDIVMGPMYTTARLEALAAGKRYIGFMIPPNAFDPSYYDHEDHLTDLDQLPETLQKGTFQDNASILQRYNVLEPTQDPSTRFWAAFTQ